MNNIKRFFLSIYLIFILLLFIILYLSITSINIYSVIKDKKVEFNHIYNLYEVDNIDKINMQFGVNLIVFDGKNYLYGKERLTEFLENNINSLNSEKLIHHNNIFYYIKNNKNLIICMYSHSNIADIIAKNFLIIFCIFLILSIILYYIFKVLIIKNIIKPLEQISIQLPKLKDRNEDINFPEYEIEEINKICFEINRIKKNFKNMDSMLKIEKSKIDYILDNMNEGFILIDKHKNVLIINKMAKKILDCEDAILGENIFYYTQNIKIIENIEKVIKTKQKNIFDFNTDDNKIYSIHINKIQKGVFQKYSGIIMLLIDITAERQTQKMRQEFFSNVSHELKTPITSIQGYTELLYNDFAISKEQEKEFLKIIQKEISNIINLINNILTISKLENKELEINSSEVNIKVVVEDIISSTKPMCIEKNILVKNNCEDIFFMADYKKLHQLFNNLIVNAIKYNKVGGYVEITCIKKDNNIIITVKDNGIGIPLVDRNRIFERFYRVQKGRSKNDGGTGLGLAIVKHIVQYYNGRIKVKSTEGFGSEFIIKIPIQK